MKEYIEREALIARYDAEHVGPPGRARELMVTAPAADVAEVRRGKNLCEDDPSRFECSECGWTCWDTYCGDTITYSFCPNCGADMRERNLLPALRVMAHLLSGWTRGNT